MTDLTRIPVPPSLPAELRPVLQKWQVEVLAAVDARNAQWAGASGYVANADGTITLKAGAGIDGRTGSSLPTVLQRLANNGTASDSRLINLVNYANRNSVQSADDILTSSSGASSSTISVAAHTVKFDYGTVSYGSGSIAGLNTATDYLVYADDTTPPAGGAVSYAATTNPSDLIATGRYFVGTITTAIAATSGTVTAATAANPIVLTIGTHGWTTGQQAAAASFTGAYAALNGNTYTITVVSPTQVSVPVDGTAFGAWVSGGTLTRVSTSTQGGGGAGAGGGGGGGIWDGYNIP